MSQGIIVGADENIAWLLPWWWKYYSKHNSLPVTFVDFGLSEKTRVWCQERGEVIPFSFEVAVVPQAEVDPQDAAAWEHLYGKQVWQAREGWFKKPFAMLLSPYEETVWMDVDCEVCKTVAPLFEVLKEADISLAFDPGRPEIYNSGVVVFRKKTQLLYDWAEACATQSGDSIGDDYLVSRLILEKRYPFAPLPQLYNWWAGLEVNLDATIVHWAAWGKTFIATHGGWQGMLER